jgi:hypothetical protein
MKGSGWFLKPPPSSFVPFIFPFLSQLSVCLCVSHVRAYLTTNQQHGIPCLFKRGPLPDWPVWTRAQMEGSATARGEGSAQRRREREPPWMRARQPFAQRVWLKSQETMSPQRTMGEPPSPKLWPQGQANLSLLSRRRSDRLGSR